MLAAITSEMADRCEARGVEREPAAVSKTVLSLTGDQGFESIPLQRRESCANLTSSLRRIVPSGEVVVQLVTGYPRLSHLAPPIPTRKAVTTAPWGTSG